MWVKSYSEAKMSVLCDEVMCVVFQMMRNACIQGSWKAQSECKLFVVVAGRVLWFMWKKNAPMPMQNERFLGFKLREWSSSWRKYFSHWFLCILCTCSLPSIPSNTQCMDSFATTRREFVSWKEGIGERFVRGIHAAFGIQCFAMCTLNGFQCFTWHACRHVHKILQIYFTI